MQSILVLVALVAAEPEKPFAITVVDAQTGRGVALVELRTVNHVRLVTDSNGIAAFREPGLMSQTVFFHVSGHGYEFPKDGFGIRGRKVDVTPGGSVTLKINRVNIAERLYRVTGAGLYRDSVLVGAKVPIKEPLLNARVLGSDSVMNAVYQGKLHWFWGDTNRPGYPLGNFHVPGATSELPGSGGLDPSRGVDLTYFVGDDGFARLTAQMPGDGPTWISGLAVLPDAAGKERMLCGYVKIKPPLTAYRRGIAEWDDKAQCFEQVSEFDADAPLYPHGNPFVHQEDDGPYVYFASPFPLVRTRATAEAF